MLLQQQQQQQQEEEDAEVDAEEIQIEPFKP